MRNAQGGDTLRLKLSCVAAITVLYLDFTEVAHLKIVQEERFLHSKAIRPMSNYRGAPIVQVHGGFCHLGGAVPRDRQNHASSGSTGRGNTDLTAREPKKQRDCRSRID